MTRLVARLRVILTALPTWLGVVALAAPLVAQQVADLFPHGAERVVSIVLTIGAVATAAINVIARVTPVPRSDVGLLPNDAGQGAIDVLIKIVVLVIVIVFAVWLIQYLTASPAH